MKSHFLRPNFSFSGWVAPDRLPFAITLVLLISAFLMVGGGRDDLLSLLFWRPLSAFLLAISVALLWTQAWKKGRSLLVFCLAVVALIALHLIPLPPAVWSMLPGRDILVQTYQAAGMQLPWQPLSMAQARTWNAFFSLAGPLAMVIAVLALDRSRHRQILVLLIAIGFVSGFIGMIQALGPDNGILYFYRITNPGTSVGLFANRNHQAVFLATIFPLLAANLSLFKGRPDQLFFHRSITLAAAALLVPLILMTGSRAGLVLGAVGVGLAWWVYQPPVAKGRVEGVGRDHRSRLVALGIAAILLGVVVLVAVSTPSLQRILETDAASELRIQALPVLAEATRTFMPFGSGIGTFVEAYQIFEPDWLVSSSYFNHAHNDFVELAMTGGLPAIALLIWAGGLGFSWLLTLIRNRKIGPDMPGLNAMIIGRAGCAVLAMLALASAADYPLRTPSLMLYAMIMAAWCSSAHRLAGK